MLWERGHAKVFRRLLFGFLALSSVHLPPTARALVSSLRGLGYSLQTAVADLIDNSISAEATRVDITIEWRAEAIRIAIRDDGAGLSRDRLIEAMRFGANGPNAERREKDLGRFGLGLKTASLSQARRFTVASWCGDEYSVFRWDIDHLERADASWDLLEGAAVGSEHCFGVLHAGKRGTMVLWENVDFGRKAERPDAEWFRGELALLERHLGMVFHRFLGDGRLKIFISGAAVAAWDPFLEGTDPPSDRIGVDSISAPGGRVRVAGFVMPHPDRFANSTELARAGGPEGWTAQQGFYVYRGDRILTHGGWMGLGRRWTRASSSQLARIRVEIPTSADTEWQIDVKKSVARPPATVRRRLEALATSVRDRAREVYAHRGPSNSGGRRMDRRSLWLLSNVEGEPRYRLDRDHPVVKSASDGRDALSNLLALIERTLPIERIWLDRSEAEGPAPPSSLDKELIRIAVETVSRRVQNGETLDQAITAVANAEPFDTTPDIAVRIRAELE